MGITLLEDVDLAIALDPGDGDTGLIFRDFPPFPLPSLPLLGWGASL